MFKTSRPLKRRTNFIHFFYDKLNTFNFVMTFRFLSQPIQLNYRVSYFIVVLLGPNFDLGHGLVLGIGLDFEFIKKLYNANHWIGQFVI